MLQQHHAVKCFDDKFGADEGRYQSHNLPAQTAVLSYDKADNSTEWGTQTDGLDSLTWGRVSLYCLKTEILLAGSTEQDTLAACAETMAHQAAEEALSGAAAKLNIQFTILVGAGRGEQVTNNHSQFFLQSYFPKLLPALLCMVWES